MSPVALQVKAEKTNVPTKMINVVRRNYRRLRVSSLSSSAEIRKKLVNYINLYKNFVGMRSTPDPAQHELGPNKSLYLFYENCGAEEMSYSLYEVSICSTKNKKSDSPRLVKEFSRSEFPAEGMKCAQLGSKLYFLGGSYQESYKRVHPRDVYVLDVTTGKLEKMKATLNTGKPHPCAVFAVGGKLYALGTIIYDPYNPSTLSPLESSDPSTLSPSESFNPSTLSLLECLDPDIGVWQVVNDLPPSENKSIFWVGCTVLEKRQEVVLVGSERPVSDHVLVKFVYDIKKEKDKWTRNPIFRYEEGRLTLSFHEGDDQGYLYGIHCGGLPSKSKPESLSKENASFDGLIQMSISKNILNRNSHAFHQPYLNSSRTVRHLGSNYFCYITSGSKPKDRDELGYLYSDPNSRGIMITLFKESEGKKHRFKASILNSKSYTIETRRKEAQAELVECFVVTPESTV